MNTDPLITAVYLCYFNIDLGSPSQSRLIPSFQNIQY